MNFTGSFKFILAINFCMLHFLPCLSQPTRTDLQKMNLRGQVKSIEYESYAFTMKKKKKSKEWSQTFFNEAGFKTMEVSRNLEDPEVMNRHEYSYDISGNL